MSSTGSRSALALGRPLPRTPHKATAAHASADSRVVPTEPPLALLAAIFPDFTPAALKELCAGGRVVDYPARVTLCRAGDTENRFYVVVDGRVDAYKLVEGELIFINHMERGGHFGEIALLLDLPRTATIMTAEPSRIFEVDRNVFGSVVRAHSEAAIALSQLVIKRFLAQEEKHLVEIARLKKHFVPRPPKVFVSYARADLDFVTRLVNNLLKHQIDVWLDVYRLNPGKSWARQVGEALDSCHVMLLVLSPASVASGNVEDEWNYYLDRKKAAVTIVHEPCEIPYRLSKFQYIDFHSGDYDLAVARLVATLNTQIVVRRGAKDDEAGPVNGG
jgi:CRP-like cAMP-binding protein